MTIVEPVDEQRPDAPTHARIAVTAEAVGGHHRRRVVLNKEFLSTTKPPPVENPREQRETDDHRPPSPWLRLAERVLGDWGPTLRVSLPLVVILIGTIVTVAVTISVANALLLAIIAVTTNKALQRPPHR